MAVRINSAADARYYAARANSLRTNSSTSAKKTSSSIISSVTKTASSLASTAKNVVKKNSSSATTTTKKNNTNAAVNAASASIKSKTNQNKKTTTTVSSAVSKVASSISKAVTAATNAVNNAVKNTKTSTTKTASKTATSTKNTTNAKAATVTNTSNTKKTTSSGKKDLASSIISTVNSAASTVKKASSKVNTAVAAEKARQEAAARAKAEEQAAMAKAAAMAKSRPSAKATSPFNTTNKTTQSTLTNNYSGYGPFKPTLSSSNSMPNTNNKIDSQITYHIPYTENKTNIIKDDFTLLPPDNKEEFGYVLYNGKQYPITYNKTEENKQYFFPSWKETYHLQPLSISLKFDFVTAITNNSPEEFPKRELATANGKILLQKDAKQEYSKKYKKNDLDISNHKAEYVYFHAGYNAISFIQDGLIRDNFDIILMEDGSNNLASAVTFSQDYLGENPAGIKEKQCTPIQLLAISEDGTLYNVNTSKEYIYEKK